MVHVSIYQNQKGISGDPEEKRKTKQSTEFWWGVGGKTDQHMFEEIALVITPLLDNK